MLEASNLGQVIGRLMYARTDESPAAPPAVASKHHATGQTARIREALQGHTAGLLSTQVTAMTGIDAKKTSSLLSMMKDAEKLGDLPPYRWRLKSNT
jgi:hypothetical protein